MTMDSTKPATGIVEDEHFLCDDWFDPLETGVRIRIRGFIEGLLEAELDAALGRDRYERAGKGGGHWPAGVASSRHGHRERGLLGTFGAMKVRVPRARLATAEGKTAEWRNATIPAYQRRTKRADALMTDASSPGAMHMAPAPLTKHDSGGWALWEKLAKGHTEFGNPAAFNASIAESYWESFTVTLKNPLKGKGAAGKVGGRGDEYVTLKIMLPDKPDAELEDFVARWGSARADGQSAAREA